ncbi:hypothetical protein DUNSADRAFT_11352 [Dunaliella salina]|uniref:Encoded protein n=1 Tax=Dunaliella salina TaxID=3046 RepID=A0ABQ7GDL2_DUNSA|nr:hypothetical protein DUNSADRAFT_11352 [Dunaliella salina]|eukprot:KAF5832707.1 hypothetical protein DUNSADRAFT_11352 [Dunaliella salina]
MHRRGWVELDSLKHVQVRCKGFGHIWHSCLVCCLCAQVCDQLRTPDLYLITCTSSSQKGGLKQMRLCLNCAGGGLRPGAMMSSALPGTAAVPGVAVSAGDAAGQSAYCTSRNNCMLRVLMIFSTWTCWQCSTPSPQCSTPSP